MLTISIETVGHARWRLGSFPPERSAKIPEAFRVPRASPSSLRGCADRSGVGSGVSAAAFALFIAISSWAGRGRRRGRSGLTIRGESEPSSTKRAVVRTRSGLTHEARTVRLCSPADPLSAAANGTGPDRGDEPAQGAAPEAVERRKASLPPAFAARFLIRGRAATVARCVGGEPPGRCRSSRSRFSRSSPG